MFGVPNGLIICNNGRLDEINKRIEDRNIPSQPLKPAFSMRPQLSKYNYMPIVNDSLICPSNLSSTLISCLRRRLSVTVVELLPFNL